jgi:hypothetical protein
MDSPTMESLVAAARTGVTVIQPSGQTVRIPGASAMVGNAIVDVMYDPESGSFSWMIDGVIRSTEWMRLFSITNPSGVVALRAQS